MSTPAASPAASADPFVLAFGDSLVAGYGLAAADALPAQLQQRLRRAHPHAVVQPAGVSGDSTGDALRRLPPLLGRLARRPDLALVQIGANDVLRGVAPAVMRDRLDAILTEFDRCGIPVLLTLLQPPALLAARAAAYLGIHERLAVQHGATTCAFFPAGVMGHPAMVLADRVHPNAAAIARVADALAPVVAARLRGEARAAA